MCYSLVNCDMSPLGPTISCVILYMLSHMLILCFCGVIEENNIQIRNRRLFTMCITFGRLWSFMLIFRNYVMVLKVIYIIEHHFYILL